MNILGIIVEYNPFHNGHLYHINESKKISKADKCIAIMSGNYMQRGMPALCDKHLRTEMALKHGVDMVIELPVHYASSSAEYFASASINILNSTGIVNSLCFGTEIGELENIYECANVLLSEPDIFKKSLKNFLTSGVSYPKARQEALSHTLNKNCDFLNNPNNILGLEYIKALIKTSSNIKPYAIKRHIADYHSTNIMDNISSATAIRKALNEKDYISVQKSTPNDVAELLIKLAKNNIIISNMDSLSHILHYILKSSNHSDLSSISGITEGLENRILSIAEKHFKISDILNHLKCKRYTLTKLQRCLLHIILNIKEIDIINPQYIRVLGFRKDSEFLLKELKNKSSLPVLTNLKNAHKNLNLAGLAMLNKEIYATDIYYLSQEKYISSPSVKNIEYTKPLVII